jgi:type IV pilus assembly protein PilN
LIKINLVREGKAAVRGGAASAGPVSAGPANINNVLIVGFLIAAAAIAGGYWFYVNRQLAGKESTVRERKADADKLQSIIKEVEDFQKRKDSLQKRIDLINQLKQNQKGPVKIMDRISQDLPDLVWLDSMTENAGKIDIKGKGLNPNAIANFIENIKSDPLFEEPELGNLTQTNLQPLVYSFDMTFHFTYAPKKPGATGTSGTTSTTGTATSTSSSGVPGGSGK